MTLANLIIRYMETLTVTLGDCAGEKFTVLPWEKKFIRGAWDPANTGDSAFSAGRGQGKSGMVAGIATAALDPEGPLHLRRGEIVCTAASFAQGKSAIFEEVLAFIREKYGYDLPSKIWRISDSQNSATLEHRPSGSRVRCTGSKAKTLHGLKPYIWLWDEPSQTETAQIDAVYAAINTGLGKVPNSKLIALGTRPAYEDHPFSKLLAGGADYVQVHAAGRNDDPYNVRTWRKANPSLSIFPSLLERIRKEAEDAQKDANLLPQFRALRLNQGVSDTEIQMLIGAETWTAAEGDAEQAGEYALGLDLGGTAAMSGAAGYWINSGRLDTLACFGNIPSLAERGLADGCGGAYIEMYNRGELILSEGRVSSIRDLLDTILERWGAPAALIVDRWREGELRDELARMRFPRCPLITRGMGFLDGSADVRGFRKAVLKGHVTPVKSLLMRSAMSEARVIMDVAGNSKLAKKVEGGRRLKARDDAAAAGILAVAAGARHARR